jgi:hypothetical protein
MSKKSTFEVISSKGWALRVATLEKDLQSLQDGLARGERAAEDAAALVACGDSAALRDLTCHRQNIAAIRDQVDQKKFTVMVARREMAKAVEAEQRRADAAKSKQVAKLAEELANAADAAEAAITEANRAAGEYLEKANAYAKSAVLGMGDAGHPHAVRTGLQAYALRSLGEIKLPGYSTAKTTSLYRPSEVAKKADDEQDFLRVTA